jgi:hypothetical protein
MEGRARRDRVMARSALECEAPASLSIQSGAGAPQSKDSQSESKKQKKEGKTAYVGLAAFTAAQDD